MRELCGENKGVSNLFGVTDYWITHVTYSRKSGKTLINEALVHPNVGSSHEFGEKWTRDEVLRKANFLSISVLRKNEKGITVRRDDVRVISINDSQYIRIDDELIEEDFLGSFPDEYTK